MNARGEWLSVLALASLVSVYLSHRSRFVPSLTAASRACLAFCAIDGVRLLLDVARPLSPWAAWIDVVLWVSLSGTWAWLLTDPRSALDPTPSAPIVTVAEVPRLIASTAARHVLVGRLSLACLFLRHCYKRPRLMVHRTASDLRHAAILTTVAVLAYAAFLLALRHPLAAHWTVALQAPRLMVGAWALLVALKAKRSPGMMRRAPLRRVGGRRAPLSGAAGSFEGPSHVAPVKGPGCSRLGGLEGPYHLPPSVVIGVVLALFAAASVVGGLWVPGWTGVRVVSVAGWLVAALVGRLAKE